MKKKQPPGLNAAAAPAADLAEPRAKANRRRSETSEWLSIEEALRVTRAQLQQLSAQHLTIQESERRRVALELHDGLGQTLSLAKLSMQEAIRSLNIGASDDIKNQLERAISQIKSALDDLRRIAMNLRPSTLDDLGIVATMNWYFREVEGAHPDMTVEREINLSESDVPEPLKITIFRIVQEAVGNALKHADADRISVSLTSAGGLLNLAIEDNGRGFDAKGAAGHRDFTHGIGLQSMKERAELSGASYEFQSSPGQGTRMWIKWLPVQSSGPDCPILPMKRDLAQSMCKSAPDSELPEQFTACLSCVRSLDIN